MKQRVSFFRHRLNVAVRVVQPSATKEKSKKMDLEGWLKIIGLFTTAISLFLTYSALRNTQNWKVAEFTASEFKKFSEDPDVDAVSSLLDYNSKSVKLFGDSTVYVTDDLLYEALVIDTIRGEFTPTEARIRDAFDNYFDQMALFNKYLDAELINKDQMAPYLKYQIDILANPKNKSKSPELRNRIWDYLRYYKYADVISLFRKFGYDVPQ